MCARKKTDVTEPKRKYYVSNKELLEEFYVSRDKNNGVPTDRFVHMSTLIIEHLAAKKRYVSEDDKKDCMQTALMDVLLYWKSFNPDKSSNIFAYLTSLCCNGLSKGWSKLSGKIKRSEMISLDSNIHTL